MVFLESRGSELFRLYLSATDADFKPGRVGRDVLSPVNDSGLYVWEGAVVGLGEGRYFAIIPLFPRLWPIGSRRHDSERD
jgi:hypothetical protein